MESDPYKTPAAALTELTPLGAKVYSVNQISTATFLGSPLSGCWLMAHNYALLGAFESRRRALAWGVLLTLALLGLSAVLPKRLPTQSLIFLCTIAIREAAKREQGADIERLLARGATQASWWGALGIALATVVAVMAALFVVVTSAALLGIPPPPGWSD